MKSRLLSVWLPAWPIERLRRALQHAGRPIPWITVEGREVPFALVESGPRGLALTAVNAAAWKAGIRPGRTLADSRAALPTLLTRTAEPALDRKALAALAAWTGRYGPRRNVEDGDGSWIDITGVAHLFGNEQSLAADLLERLGRAGLAARIAIADSPGAAYALARFAASHHAPCQIAPPGGGPSALAPLPIEALRLPSDAALLLRRLGLRRIGQLYDLPREALAQRFRNAAAMVRSGSRRHTREALLMAGVVLTRLDQALARAPEPRLPLEELPVHRAQLLFPEPLISTEGVTAAVDHLAVALESLLTNRCQGGTRFVLGLYRADGTAQHVALGASRPCRDASHLKALLGDKLDALDAGFGIDAMTFAATHVEPLEASQIALAGSSRAAREEAAATLVDRLSNRLGDARVLRIEPALGHIPERAERRVAMLAAHPTGQTRTADVPWPARVPRPALLLCQPEPITVLAAVPEGPPLRFSWRRRTRRITRAQGPERIAPEWWRSIGRPPGMAGDTALALHLARPRDYYFVEDEQGGRYWVFRAGYYDGREGEDADEIGSEGTDSETSASPILPVWFMHGVFG